MFTVRRCLFSSSNSVIRNTRPEFTQAKTADKTVDEQEVVNFKKSSQNWWDAKGGNMVPLHSMNNVRIPLIRTGLINMGKLTEAEVNSSSQYLKGIKILDVGCGGGILSIPLSRLGADVTGIDPVSDLIDIAEKEAESRLSDENKIKFLSTTIEDHMPSNKEAYDVVVLSEVIEHVSNKEAFLKFCADTLKPSGSLFITTLNRTTVSWMGAIIFCENIINLLPRGSHEWEKFISPEELTKYLRNVDCQTVLTSGLLYVPIVNKWYWVPSTSISYALHAVKCNSEISGE